MLRALILAAAAAAAPLSPTTQAVIAPVHAAIEQVSAEEAKLPPPATDKDRLLRMREREQAPRRALSAIDFSKIPEADRNAAYAAIWQEITPIDQANEAALVKMLPPEGWFTIAKYGPDASEAAFLIVQHAPLDYQERFLPVIERFATQHEIKGGDYGLLYDRVAMRHGKAQRYGSQMHCAGGRWVPYAIEDEAHIDARRAALGMTPYAQNLARFANNPPCG